MDLHLLSLISLAATGMDLNTTSLISSAFATAATFYFWLVRARRESPSVKLYLVDPIVGEQSYSRKGDNMLSNNFFLRCAVANNSWLPNAVIGIRAAVKARDGRWQPATVSASEAGLPLNLPPMQTAALHFAVAFDTPGTLTGTTSEDRRKNAMAAASSPLQVKVELRGLAERRFVTDLTQISNDPSPLV